MDGTPAISAAPTADAGSGTALSLMEAVDAVAPFLENPEADTAPAIGNRAPAKGTKGAEVPALTDDQVVALRDGTEVSIRELKRGYISRKVFTGKTQALAEERSRLAEMHNTVTQHAHSLNAMWQALVRAADALMPRRPDLELVDVDPQTWKALQADYEFKLELLAEVQQAAQIEQELAAEEAAAAHRDHLQRLEGALQVQREKLLETLPKLRDPLAYASWWRMAQARLGSYGYTPQEIETGMVDHRLYRMVDDLMTPQTKQPDKAHIPLMKGGVRKSRDAAAQRARQSDSERLRRTGRLQDAAAIIQHSLMAES